MACPEAEDDRRYGFGLAAACMSWAIIRLQRFVLLDTRAPGDDSRPQLVEPLEAAACTATAHRAFPPHQLGSSHSRPAAPVGRRKKRRG